MAKKTTYAIHGVLDVLEVIETKRAVNEAPGPELGALGALEHRWLVTHESDTAVAKNRATSTTVFHASTSKDRTQVTSVAPQRGRSCSA